MRIIVVIIIVLFGGMVASNGQSWKIESQQDWFDATRSSYGIEINNGQAVSKYSKGTFISKMTSYKKKRQVESIVLNQSSNWDNCKEVPNVGPEDTLDAIVLIPIKENDYWFWRREVLFITATRQS